MDTGTGGGGDAQILPEDLIRYGTIIAILWILYLISTVNFLLFHGIVEIAAVSVASAIFIIVWNTRRTSPDSFFLIVGISFLFTGGIDLLHMLAYKGMGVFAGNDANLPTQLWIAARYFQSITFLVATFFIGKTITRDRRNDATIILCACSLACALILAGIFFWQNFPACYIEGSGLTGFKIASEYLIAFIFTGAAVILYRKRDSFNRSVWQYLVAAQVFLVASELAFTLYTSVYGFMNMAGHLLRIVSVYLFYRAFIVDRLWEPHELLERAYMTISASEEELRANYDELAQTQQALAESERKYQNLYHYAQVGLFETSFSTATLLACNKRYADLAGFESVEDAIGSDILQLYVNPADRTEVGRILREQGYIENYTLMFRNRRTGREFWGQFSARFNSGRNVAEGSIVDVTEQKDAEDSLRESERHLKRSQEVAHLGSWEHDLVHNTLTWSDEVYRIFGLQPQEFGATYTAFLSYVHPDDRASVDAAYAGSLREDRDTYEIEHRIVLAKSGEIRTVHEKCDHIRNEEGRIIRSVGIVHDITDVTKAEEALRESSRRLQEAQELAHLGFWSWDIRTGEVQWSDEVYRIFGLDKSAFTPRIDSILARSPWPDEQQRGRELILRATESREPGTYEQRFLRPDNRIGYYHSTFQGRYDDAGRLTSIVGTVLDITGRRMAEDALRESEVRFRTLVEQLPLGIVMSQKDANGETAFYYNRIFTEMTGYTLEDVPNFEKWAQCAYPDPAYRESLVPLVQQMYGEAAHDVTSQPLVTRVTCRDGTIRDIEFRYTDMKVFGFWTLHDITERVRAEEAMHASEEKFVKMFQSSPDLITLTTIPEGKILAINDSSIQVSGYSPAEVLGRSTEDLGLWVDLSDRDRYRELFRTEKRVHNFETRFRQKSGAIINVLLSGTIITVAGKPCFISVVHDITSRKRVETALLESEEKIRLLLNSTAEAIYGLDMHGNCTFCNTACLRILKYHRQDELLRKNMHSLIHYNRADGSPFPIEECRIFSAFQRGEGTHVDDEVLWRADGTSFHAEYWSYPQYYKGEVIGAVVTFVDITDRKQAEEALRQSEEKFRLVGENAPDAIIIQAGGKFAYVNPAACRLFGAESPQDLIGRPVVEQFRPDYRTIVSERIQHVNVNRESVRTVEEIIQKLDGAPVDVEVSAMPVTYMGSEGALVFLRDISERKRAEEVRERLISELERKNAELERFTYTVSHDLKSPLITIKGFAGIAEVDAIKGDIQQLAADLNRITEAADVMQALLSDLLELSRIGKIASSPQPVPFGLLVQEAVDLLAGPIAERGVRVEIAPDLPVVYADRVRMREVLTNLIENAIKFSGKRPDPVIHIGMVPADDGPHFFIRDNGIGINPLYLNRIFNLFERLDVTVPGTGIGLPIIRRIIEVHGGKIWAESEGEGQGTTFWFTLPEGSPGCDGAP